MARDKYHYETREALEKDGWTITHDPFHLPIGSKDVFIDLAAERLLAAEKEGEKIAVEIKSFLSRSFLADFYEAVGKFITYEDVLSVKDPSRRLFLAVPSHIYDAEMEKEQLVEVVLKNRRVHVIVVDIDHKIIVKWIR